MPGSDTSVAKRRHVTAASAAAKAADKAHRAAAVAVLASHPSRLRSAHLGRRRASCDSGYSGSDCPSHATLRRACGLYPQSHWAGTNAQPDQHAGRPQEPGNDSRVGVAGAAALPPAPAESAAPGRALSGRAIGESSIRRSGSVTSEEGSTGESHLSARGPVDRQSPPLAAASGHSRPAGGSAAGSRGAAEAGADSSAEPLEKQNLSGKLWTLGSSESFSFSRRRVSDGVEEAAGGPVGIGGGVAVSRANSTGGGLAASGAPGGPNLEAPRGGTPSTSTSHAAMQAPPVMRATASRQGGQPSPVGGRAGALAAALRTVSEARAKLKEAPTLPPTPLVMPGGVSSHSSPLPSPAGVQTPGDSATRLPPVSNMRSRHSLTEPPLHIGDSTPLAHYGSLNSPDAAAAALAVPKPLWPVAVPGPGAAGVPAAWRSSHTLNSGLGGIAERGDRDVDDRNGGGSGSGVPGVLAARQSTGSAAEPPLSPAVPARQFGAESWDQATAREASMAEWVAQRFPRSSVHLLPLKAGAGSSASGLVSGGSVLEGQSNKGLRALLADRGDAASWYARPARW